MPRIVIVPVLVGLPQLDDCIRDGAARAVNYMAADPQADAGRHLGRQIPAQRTLRFVELSLSRGWCHCVIVTAGRR